MIELQPGTGDDRGFYRAEETFTESSDVFILRGFHNNVSVTVAPTSGTAKVETTQDSHAAIQAETADWVAWPLGDVSERSNDTIFGSATAIRAISTGDCTVQVLAK